MKRLLNILIAVIMLTSLSACVVVPRHERLYYGGYYGHYDHHEGRGYRRW